MKKIIAFILCVVLILGVLTSCSGAPERSENKLSIVTTIFPEFDWVRNILGSLSDKAELTMLLDTGVDLHNYQPTADDIIKITSCDMFIYVGGESDKWVADIFKNSANDKCVVINLFDVLSENLKEEEIKEGMQAEEEDDDDDEEENEIEYDEHVWLSLKNASVICKYIAEKISQIDPVNKDVYEANASAYIEKINALDSEYAQTVSDATVKTLVFADRFPFRYMTSDYGLDYFAAFIGCSAETEASFETIKFLARKVDELSIDNVFTLEGSDQKIAKTVIETTKTKNQNILVLNSLQSVTAQQVSEGADYLTIMTSNLEVLKQALK